MEPALSEVCTELDFPRPPTEDELPYDDGEPMESDKHRQQMELCLETLQLALADRDDVYVGGNLGLYFSETQTKKNEFRAPDVMVVLDTVRRARKSWVVWHENGRTPNVVIELLSASTEAQDRGPKMRVYATVLRVPEYYLFDPWSGRLEGYALDPQTRGYVPIHPLPNGDLPCHQLGLCLGVRTGRYQGEEGAWLRWMTSENVLLPTGEEMADAERERADAERERAEAERQRADAERERADAERERAEAERERADAERERAEGAEQEVQRLRTQVAALSQKP